MFTVCVFFSHRSLTVLFVCLCFARVALTPDSLDFHSISITMYTMFIVRLFVLFCFSQNKYGVALMYRQKTQNAVVEFEATTCFAWTDGTFVGSTNRNQTIFAQIQLLHFFAPFDYCHVQQLFAVPNFMVPAAAMATIEFLLTSILFFAVQLFSQVDDH